MQENYKEKKNPDDSSKRNLGFDRTNDTKKPYEAPSLTKLGDVVAMTNVSVIV